MLDYYPPSSRFKQQKQGMINRLLSKEPFHTEEWQAMETTGSAAHATHELLDVTVEYVLPLMRGQMALEVGPDLPWAEDHFQERISGEPMNPAPSHEYWPYAVGGNSRHLTEQKFDHTYPERFWPKLAGSFHEDTGTYIPAHGIRFDYGDYQDVVKLLMERPHTRQAYLPIWFPEDTWAAGAQRRVPCTLGYHFLIRNNRLSMRYYIRSCDIYRHYSNDVYMACRLMYHTAELINKTRTMDNKLFPGNLIMHIASLHAFVGDTPKLQKILEERV